MPRTNPAAGTEYDSAVTYPDGKKYRARELTRDQDVIVGINKQIIPVTDGRRFLVDHSTEYKPKPVKKVTPPSQSKKSKKKGKK